MRKLHHSMIWILCLYSFCFWPGSFACQQKTGEAGAGDSATKGIAWSGDLKTAVEKARKEKKNIILDLYTDWCGWCKKMDATTFTDPKVIDLSQRMVFLKLNAETEPDGIELQQRLRIDSFPTTMIMDSSGEEIERIPGYLTAEMFIKSVDEVLNSEDSLTALIKKEAENGNNLDLLYRLGERFYQKRNYTKAKVRFDHIIVKDSGNRSKLVGEAYFYKALCCAHMEQMEEAIALLEKVQKSYSTSKYAPDSDLLRGEILIRSHRPAEAKKVFQSFLQRYPQHRMVEEVRQMLAQL